MKPPKSTVAAPSETGSRRMLLTRFPWGPRLVGMASAEGFPWEALDHPDDDVARVAWGRLAAISERIGVPEEAWVEALETAGWPGWWTPPDEEDRDG